ncbi:zinc finger protein 436-like [Rhineura floridana]|uniref:zinc finger protein 436-like n=1 Tax=Rhineura floridana TaxID=261503 RepID=UPI002AC7FAE0|nr:zinc finger protein 436-like [Rhineura floridana]
MEEQNLAGPELERRLEVAGKAPFEGLPEGLSANLGRGRSCEVTDKELQRPEEAHCPEFLRGLDSPRRGWGNPLLLGNTPRDNVRAFLSSFEQIAEACQWPREEWVGQLLPSLSRDVEQALGRLETADREDYGKVKAAILREDIKRMETLRQRFRQSRYQEVEDPRRVYQQLRELCHQWLKPERRTKDQILDLLILEQFLAILPHDLQTWVREEGPENCTQAVALVEDFQISRQKAEPWKWQVPFQEVTRRPLEPQKTSSDPSRSTCPYMATTQKCDGDTDLLANGTACSSHSSSSFPPEGQEVAKAGPTEVPASFREKGVPFDKAEPSLMHPGQRTLFWQVKEENCGTMGSLEGLLIPKLDLAFHPEKGGKMFFQDSDTGKRRGIKVENSHQGETEPEDESQGNVSLVADVPGQKCESKGHQEANECSDHPKAPLSESTKHFGMEKPISSNYGRNDQYKLGLVKMNAEESPYECPVCGESFQQEFYLAEHQRMHMGEEPYEWSERQKPFPQRELWVSHQSDPREEKPYECPECGKRFSYRATLMRHQRVHTEEKPHKCSHCGKSFSQRTNLMSHLRIHTGERPYQCSQCGKGFRWQLHLKRHQKIHTGEKPHECPDCGKSFSRRDTLINHRRTHTGEKPYECPDCGRNFNHPCNLIEHQKTHTGEKPHECPECGKNFSRRDTLIKHQRTHTGEKPYECPECGKSFNHPCRLIDHQKIHTGEKPHECPECGKNFSRRDTLIKHQRTHAEEKPYECPECGKTFIQKKAFIRHQIIHLGHKSG